MEMRGFGTIYGAEQSGAVDLGLDLQAKVLELSLAEIRKELILAGRFQFIIRSSSSSQFNIMFFFMLKFLKPEYVSIISRICNIALLLI